MRQSPLLAFQSSAFAVIPGEDEATNPGFYGRALAQWLAEQLCGVGVPAGGVFAEDFGWCIEVESSPHRLTVVCASTPEEPGVWKVFAFAEGGMMARVFGKDENAESLASLFTAVRSCIESNPSIHSLHEESDDE